MATRRNEDYDVSGSIIRRWGAGMDGVREQDVHAERPERLLALVQLACVACVAIPAAGAVFLLLREAIAETDRMLLNTAFHLVLALTLLVLAGCFSAAILRSRRPEVVLLLGMGGFLAVVLGLLLSELLGPPVLLLLLFVCVMWTVALLRRTERHRKGEAALNRAS